MTPPKPAAAADPASQGRKKFTVSEVGELIMNKKTNSLPPEIVMHKILQESSTRPSKMRRLDDPILNSKKKAPDVQPESTMTSEQPGQRHKRTIPWLHGQQASSRTPTSSASAGSALQSSPPAGKASSQATTVDEDTDEEKNDVPGDDGLSKHTSHQNANAENGRNVNATSQRKVGTGKDMYADRGHSSDRLVRLEKKVQELEEALDDERRDNDALRDYLRALGDGLRDVPQRRARNLQMQELQEPQAQQASGQQNPAERLSEDDDEDDEDEEEQEL